MIYKQAQGFSMVELIVVMIIIAILSSIAYPSYMKSQRSARRNDAYSGLVEIKSIIDNYLATNTTTSYSAWNNVTANANISYPKTSKAGYYNFNISAFSAYPFSYIIQATAIGTQTKDSSCTIISLDNNSNKNPSACW